MPCSGPGIQPMACSTHTACLFRVQGDWCFVLEARAGFDADLISDGAQNLTAYMDGQGKLGPSQYTLQRKVCFFKGPGHAKTTIKYDMCRTGKCEYKDGGDC